MRCAVLCCPGWCRRRRCLGNSGGGGGGVEVVGAHSEACRGCGAAERAMGHGRGVWAAWLGAATGRTGSCVPATARAGVRTLAVAVTAHGHGGGAGDQPAAGRVLRQPTQGAAAAGWSAGVAGARPPTHIHNTPTPTPTTPTPFPVLSCVTCAFRCVDWTRR